MWLTFLSQWAWDGLLLNTIKTIFSFIACPSSHGTHDITTWLLAACVGTDQHNEVYSLTPFSFRVSIYNVGTSSLGERSSFMLSAVLRGDLTFYLPDWFHIWL